MTGRRDDERMLPHQDILDAFLHHLKADASPKTYRTYASILRRAQRRLPRGVVVASEDELREMIWGGRLAANSRATYTAAVARLHRWMVERDITEDGYDPTELLPRPKLSRGLPRPVPADQLAVILAETREPVRTWCLISVYTGARCCEIAELDRADITPETVRLMGKGRKPRIVPTHPKLWAAVQPLPAGPVAPGNWTDPAGRISGRISDECRRVGPDWSPRVTAHRLRHTIATEVLTRTGDLRIVQELLGHASPATTAIYALVVPGRLAGAVAQLPDWTGPEAADGAAPA